MKNIIIIEDINFGSEIDLVKISVLEIGLGGKASEEVYRRFTVLKNSLTKHIELTACQLIKRTTVFLNTSSCVSQLPAALRQQEEHLEVLKLGDNLVTSYEALCYFP